MVLLLIPWLEFRERIFGQPDGKSVLVEWVFLSLILLLVTTLKPLATRRMNLPIALFLVAFILGSIFDLQKPHDYPQYWFGFGPRIAISSCVISIAIVILLARLDETHKPIPRTYLRYLNSATHGICFLILLWTLPTILQPTDSWLNVGDSTEKVLDEIMGWTVGNLPGTHTGWSHNSLLGFPLLPLTILPVPGTVKVLSVVLLVNLLVVSVPLFMSAIIRLCIPRVGRLIALVVAACAVSISGPMINTSMFQELSSLARLFFPVLIGYVLIRRLQKPEPLTGFAIFIFSVLSCVAFWNNFEYGFGVPIAILAVLIRFRDEGVSISRLIKTFTFGVLLGSWILVFPGVVRGGLWFGRRFGSFSDVFTGEIVKGSFNNLDPIPVLGLATISFALGIVGVSFGLQRSGLATESSEWKAASVASLYFGSWNIGSAPYFLNSGGSGSFRTQLLAVPVTLQVVALVGILGSQRRVKPPPTETNPSIHDRRITQLPGIIGVLPVALLGSLLLCFSLQVPNGIREWRRILLPSSADRHLDEWSTRKLDFLYPADISRISKLSGGNDNVGWWFSYGNAIEALTGVENLLGISAFEGTRSSTQLRLACEPLRTTTKKFVISISSAESLLKRCENLLVDRVANFDESSLAVFRISQISSS